MVDHATYAETEIHTLPMMSTQSQLLVALHGDWRDLLDARARALPSSAFEEAVGDLAARIVEHRSALFDANATLQAEHDASDRGVSAQLEANQDAIKFCTVMLGEMRAALGLTSIAAPC